MFHLSTITTSDSAEVKLSAGHRELSQGEEAITRISLIGVCYDTGSFRRKYRPEEITKQDVLMLGRMEHGELGRNLLRQEGTEYMGTSDEPVPIPLGDISTGKRTFLSRVRVTLLEAS